MTLSNTYFGSGSIFQLTAQWYRHNSYCLDNIQQLSDLEKSIGSNFQTDSTFTHCPSQLSHISITSPQLNIPIPNTYISATLRRLVWTPSSTCWRKLRPILSDYVYRSGERSIIVYDLSFRCWSWQWQWICDRRRFRQCNWYRIRASKNVIVVAD